MKNKKILAIDIPAPSGTGWQLEAVVTEISGERHLIADLYEEGEKRVRYALTDNDYCKYVAINNYRPSKKRSYDLFLNQQTTESWVRNVMISEKSRKALTEFGINKRNCSYYDEMLNKMYAIEAVQSANANMRKNIEMHNYIDNTPELPDDFGEWCVNNMQEGGLILYKRIRPHYAEYHCCRCNYEWGMFTGIPDNPYDGRKYGKIPRKNDLETCANCNYRGMLEQWGRYKWDITTKGFYLYQNIEDGVVVRYFELKRQQHKTGEWIFDLVEKIRSYMRPGKVRTYYNLYRYNYEWSTHNYSFNYAYSYMNGRTYHTKDMVIENSFLKYCNVDQIGGMYNCHYKSEPDKIAIYKTYATYQGIEILANMGLSCIVRNLVICEGKTSEIRKKQKKPADVLQIYPERVRYLCEVKGNANIWNILKFERRNCLHLTSEQLKEMEDMHWQDIPVIEQLLKYMSFTKVWNRIKDYHAHMNKAGNSQYSLAGVARTYRDYLDIREELGYDMTNSVYLHPRDLKAAHDEMVEERHRRHDEEHIAKKLKEFNKIPDKYKNLVKKYGWTNSIFVFRPAKDAEEIIREGRLQHHCVGGDNYLRKHNDGKSAIIFMRYRTTPDCPYITIEVSKGKIIQWYTAHDKKTDDPDTIYSLHNWEKLIDRRVNKSDKKAVAIAV